MVRCHTKSVRGGSVGRPSSWWGMPHQLDTPSATSETHKGEGERAWYWAPMILLQVILGGLLLGALYALFSSGLTLIWGMMNFINFAHGEFVMLGMYVALIVVLQVGGGPAVFGLAAAFALFMLGVLIYFSLIKQV